MPRSGRRDGGGSRPNDAVRPRGASSTLALALTTTATACVLLNGGTAEAAAAFSSRQPFRAAAAVPTIFRPTGLTSTLIPPPSSLSQRRDGREWEWATTSPIPGRHRSGGGKVSSSRRGATAKDSSTSPSAAAEAEAAEEAEAARGGRTGESSEEIAESLTNSDVDDVVIPDALPSSGSSGSTTVGGGNATKKKLDDKGAVVAPPKQDVAGSTALTEALSSSDGAAAAVMAAESEANATAAAAAVGPATSFLSSMGTEEERSLKRNELKLKKNVKEVKEAAKDVGDSVKGLKSKLVDLQATNDEDVIMAVANVTESSVKLGGKIIDRTPSILGRVFLGLFSKEIREDFKRRRSVYASDWTDAFDNKRQTIPAILFLYFACLAPAVSFGTIANELTGGSIGVVEFLISSGCAGMVYAALCGQPMAFIAPTGLTLAFISGLFRFCSMRGVPFFPVYAWVGLWTSLFMISLGMGGASKFIRYCTRFTDEVFNGLLSINFIYEAVTSLRRNFKYAPDPSNLTMPFVALSMALGTFYSTLQVTAFQTSKYFNKRVRTIVKDFGPVSILVGMSILNVFPTMRRFNVPTLAASVPHAFELAGGREFLVPLMSISWGVRAMCVFPAMLLTALFFMDQNISVRVVNNPDNGLKKGPGYNLDMVALGLITAGLSVCGLPWMCGATVQSLNHLRAMTTSHFNEETNAVEIDSVTETRFTGFTIHALIFATIRALPLLSYLPIPVVSGVFLYLGKKLMVGNNFIERIGDGLAERRRLPKGHPIHLLGRKKMNVFTALQIGCLASLWAFKQNPTTAIFFPSVIGMLMVIRSFVLPKFFSEEELVAIGDPTPT